MNKIKIYSPVDNSFVGEVSAMSKKHIDKSIKILKKEFNSFKDLSVVERAKYIKKAAKLIQKNEKRLAKLMAMEISKPYNDCLTEIKRSVEMIDYIVEEGIRLQGEVYNGDSYGQKDKIAITIHEPLGVVLCIAPFNYPINLSLSKIIPALITGNVVLFKPPTQGAFTCSELVKILNKALPKNVLKIATGYGSVIGDYIITHEDVAFINFTGSTAIGERIAQKSSMKGLLFELGGKDAAIVLEDADIKKAAKEIVMGAFNYSGQRCTAIKRVLVLDKVKDRLTELMLDEVKKLSVGHPMDNKTITPLIDNKSADYIQELIDDAIEKNARVLIGNKREANLIYPCLLDNVSLDTRIAFEEPFGPVLPIISVKNIDEAIEIANMSCYGLQSSVFTQDMNKAFYVVKKLEVGTVQINNKTQRGPDNFPFLGIKKSGLGVQGIKHSIISMTKIKSIVLNI